MVSRMRGSITKLCFDRCIGGLDHCMSLCIPVMANCQGSWKQTLGWATTRSHQHSISLLNKSYFSEPSSINPLKRDRQLDFKCKTSLLRLLLIISEMYSNFYCLSHFCWPLMWHRANSKHLNCYFKNPLIFFNFMIKLPAMSMYFSAVSIGITGTYMYHQMQKNNMVMSTSLPLFIFNIYTYEDTQNMSHVQVHTVKNSHSMYVMYLQRVQTKFECATSTCSLYRFYDAFKQAASSTLASVSIESLRKPGQRMAN